MIFKNIIIYSLRGFIQETLFEKEEEEGEDYLK